MTPEYNAYGCRHFLDFEGPDFERPDLDVPLLFRLQTFTVFFYSPTPEPKRLKIGTNLKMETDFDGLAPGIVVIIKEELEELECPNQNQDEDEDEVQDQEFNEETEFVAVDNIDR